MLPIVIGHGMWVIFVLAWNMTDARTPTAATPGAHRERLFKLAIAFGMVMIVLATTRPLPLWSNPPLLAWSLLLVVAAGIAFCWWAWLQARLEEEILSEGLGAAAYRDYQARAPMLVPRRLSR